MTAAIFFVLNFTGSFLELGIGRAEAGATRAEIEAFSPDLLEYIGHLHIAVTGFIAAAGLATAVFVAGAALAFKPAWESRNARG